MNDLILEIDSYLWWAVIALAVLAVALSVLEVVPKKDVKTVDRAEYDIPQPESLGGEKPAEIYGRKPSTPMDTAIAEYRALKLRSCKREITMLEQLNLIKGSRVGQEQIEPEQIYKAAETKQERDQGAKKRGFLD